MASFLIFDWIEKLNSLRPHPRQRVLTNEMKILQILVPTSLLLASCQQTPTRQQALPPIIKSEPVVAKPTKKYVAPKPKVEKLPEAPDPKIPDPTKATPSITEIPRFKVPDNLQPKVSDGINQGEFIELKW